jgi:hypothetical protein
MHRFTAKWKEAPTVRIIIGGDHAGFPLKGTLDSSP